MEELQKLRERLTAELMRLRASRKSLERLRAEALQKYLRRQERMEQKQLDESAQVAFVAKAAGWRPVHQPREISGGLGKEQTQDSAAVPGVTRCPERRRSCWLR
jgi:hypothetical protein